MSTGYNSDGADDRTALLHVLPSLQRPGSTPESKSKQPPVPATKLGLLLSLSTFLKSPRFYVEQTFVELLHQEKDQKIRRANVVFAFLHLVLLLVFLVVGMYDGNGISWNILPLKLTTNQVFLDKPYRAFLSNCTVRNCFNTNGTNNVFAQIENDLGSANRRDVCEAQSTVTATLYVGAVDFLQFPLAWVIVVVEVVTVLAHVFTVNQWVEYSVSASLMITAIASLGRITDVYTHLGLFMMSVATMLCGAATEQALRPREAYKWFITGCGFFGATWSIIITNFVSFVYMFDDESAKSAFKWLTTRSSLYTDEKVAENAEQDWDFPPWVKWAIFLPFTFFSFYPVAMWYDIHTREFGANKSTRNRMKLTYMILSFTCKICLAILIMIGVRQSNDATNSRGCSDTENTKNYWQWLVPAIFGALVLYMLQQKWR